MKKRFFLLSCLVISITMLLQANPNPNVSGVHDNQTITREQGSLDLSFGATGAETYAGVTTPFNGLYGALLRQQAVCAIEMVISGSAITQGDIVVGMHGMIDSSANSHMMFAFLTSEGVVDKDLGSSGYLTLENASASNEYMTAMLEDALGNIYISGYTSTSSTPTLPGDSHNTSAIVRAYSTSSSSTSGTAVWAAAQATTGQGVALSLQRNRTLLCVDDGSGLGHITSYIAGTVDTTFGDENSGTINATSFDLHMGPCYGLAINSDDYMYAAYVDATNSQVTVVAFEPNGSQLVSSFGIDGIVANIFSDQIVAPHNVRIGFTTNENIIVAAVTSTNLLVAIVDGVTGDILVSNTSIAINNATLLQLSRVTGVSNGTAVLTFWDNAAHDTMYVARVTSAGILDITCNAQGAQPGVLPIQIGDNYTTRIASSALVQSTPGAHQGNIVLVGYESVTASDVTPMVMRVYGDSGTTEILNYPHELLKLYRTSNAGTLQSPSNYNLIYNSISGMYGLVYGAASAIFTYPSTNVNTGYQLIGYDNATTSVINGVNNATSSIVARVSGGGSSIVTSGTSAFGPMVNGTIQNPSTTSNYTVTPFLTGITNVSIDGQNNVLTGGSSGGSGWARVISNSGRSSNTCNMPSNIAAVNNIYQQQSGRYIVAGTEKTSGKGILVAFQNVASSGTLQVDTSFNPLGVGGALAGSYYVGSTDGLYAMAINTTYQASPLCNVDTIVVAYKSGSNVVVSEITADGSGLVTTFGASGSVTTGISADSSATIRLNIDGTQSNGYGSQNIVVGASYNSGSTHQVQVQRFDSAGGTTTAFNGTGVSGGVTTITNLGSAGVVLTNLMATTTQQTVLTGYNTSGGNGLLFAARLDYTGALDSNWNVTPTSPDTAGVLTYAIPVTMNSANSSLMNIKGSALLLTGTLVSVGLVNPAFNNGSVNTPLPGAISAVTYINGDTNVRQIQQAPLAGAVGTLDGTIPGAPTGAFALSGLVTGIPQKIYIYNTAVNSSPNGAMLIASTSGATVYLTQLNQDLSLNSANFGSSGMVTLTPNSGTSPTSVTVTDMYVATGNIVTAQQYIYMCGYTTVSGTNTSFIVQVVPSGSGSPIYAPVPSGWTSTGCIRQSTNGRVLVSGYNGSHGVIVAYNPTMTAIDTTFGAAGYYITTVATPIVAMTTDSLDRIYIAYANAGGTNVIVQRLLENGTAVDSSFSATFTAGTYPTGVTNQIKMAIDLTNYMLVVAAQSGTGTGNILQVARFNYATGGTAAGTTSAITITSTAKALNIYDLFIDSNQNIYVIGNNTTDNKAIIARIASTNATTITLDTTYAAAVAPAPAGIANIAIGAGLMTATNAGMLDTDGRVYLVGSGSGNGYMGRIFNNYWYTEIYPAISQATVGVVDISLSSTGGNTGVAGIDLVSGFTNWSSLANYTAYAVIENPVGDGTAYIACGNGTNLIVGKLNADMSPVTAFGGNSTGLTTALAMSTVSNMTIDASGNIVVCGTNASLQKVVLFNSSGILQATFTNSLSATVGTTVVQQKSGRYLVGGYDGSAHGLVSAYKNASAIVSPGSSGTLALDQTFGPAANNGYYATGTNSQVDDLCIDSNDYIYIVYRVANVVTIAKLTPEGSLVTAINTPSAQVWSTNPITTTITTGITGIASTLQPARIAINSAGNILVGACTTAGMSTVLYNGLTGTIIGSVLAQTLSNNPIITRLVGSGTDFYGSIYNATTIAGSYVFAINNSGVFDTNFHGGALLQLTGQTPSFTNGINGLSVQSDGKVVAVGATATPHPILMRAYGYPYTQQYAQAPDQVGAGQLDTTLWPTTGAFLLNATSNGTFNSAITTMAVTRVYEAGNGVMTFVATNGTNSVLFRLLKDLTLDSSFNSTGYITLGNINATSLYVNPTTGNIYTAGNGASSTWAYGFTSSGSNLTPTFSASSGLATGYQIAQQSSGRVIVAGQGSVASGQANTHGYLIGYTNSGALDLAFGVSGQVDMTSSALTAITDIAIDNTVYYDNIIAVSNNSGTVVLQRVNAAGTVATTLTGGTAITGAVGNPKVVFDSAGYIVVACATSSGYAVRSYNNNLTATNNATSAVTFSAGTTSFLTNIYATSDEKITLIGYDSATTGSTAYDAIIARLVSGSTSLALDTTAFNVALTGAGTPQAGVLITSLGGSASMNQFNDGIIHADDRIMIVGSNATSAAPYMARVFGDTYVTYDTQSPAPGVAGTLNTSFGSATPATGYYSLATLTGVTASAQGKAIVPVSDGGYYMALDSGSATQLIRTLASGALDGNYGSSGSGIAATAPTGTNSMMMDGSGRIVLIGTTSGAGWIQRYQSGNGGAKDSNFGSSGVINLASGTTTTVAVEQTLGRLIVAGYNGTSGALYAYTSLDPYTVTTGAVDTTFNATVTPGTFTTGVARGIYTLIADQYDRLIFAVLNSAGTGIDLYRLTPTGELDVTFGSTGKVANALTTTTGGLSANIATNIRVALDSAGNIVVAAYTYASGTTTDSISIVAYDNGISTASGGNGHMYTNSYAIIDFLGATHTGISLTGLVTTSDGNVLVLGNQTGSSSATSPGWVARFSNTSSGGTYALDTTFNPTGSPAGIFKYTNTVGTTSPYNVYNALTINATGMLGVLGYEQTGASAYTPSLLQVYDNAYITQQSQSPNSKSVGTNDVTLGVSPTSTTAKGITFFGSSAGTPASGQEVRAIALQDDNNIVVAIDGNAAAGSGNSDVMIKMFDTDGIANSTFGSAGMVTALTSYSNQYVKDMVTFTTPSPSNVHKAIIAGYATNSILGITGSLIMQYNLSTPGLDSSFGGFNGNPSGVAFGDGKQINVIGQQTNSRIIAGGLTQAGAGLLVGYTATGLLDLSFGTNGYQATNTGTTGIYTHAIDSQNRIIIAYNNGSGTLEVSRFLADGSGLDTTFNSPHGFVATNITGLQTGVNNNFKVVIDGSGDIIVAAITGTGDVLTVYSYAPSGASTNYTASFTAGTGFPGTTSSIFTIGRLLVDALGNVIVVAYDSYPTPNTILITRLVPALTLDTTFNGTGYLTYQVSSGNTQVSNGALIHPDGRIIIIGANS